MEQSKIRPMTLDDLDFATNIGKSFAAVHPFVKDGLMVDYDAVQQVIKNIIENGVALRGDEGCILGVITPLWLNPSEYMLVEIAWWGAGEGLALLRSFEQEAKDRNIHYITMSTLGASWDDRTARILTKFNYAQSEQAWVKRI